ncbi:BLUF domain-containing protein [Frondihabitans peucedani]|uniref:BLUF domain-containing protein n=1 Tax=Frondihabitans peucedani TaxID=598626 RepID=A0ABP8E5M5_9MICO
MLSLAYISTATDPMTDAELAELLVRSRAQNRRAHITGFLLYKAGRFFQFLEGPEESVRERMAVIGADPRHRNVAILLEDQPAKRQFPQWTMGFEPVDDSLVSSIPGFRETFKAPTDSTGTGVALRQLIGWFQLRAQETASV